jgi:hypothetical protein
MVYDIVVKMFLMDWSHCTCDLGVTLNVLMMTLAGRKGRTMATTTYKYNNNIYIKYKSQYLWQQQPKNTKKQCTNTNNNYYFNNNLQTPKNISLIDIIKIWNLNIYIKNNTSIEIILKSFKFSKNSFCTFCSLIIYLSFHDNLQEIFQRYLS